MCAKLWRLERIRMAEATPTARELHACYKLIRVYTPVDKATGNPQPLEKSTAYAVYTRSGFGHDTDSYILKLSPDGKKDVYAADTKFFDTGAGGVIDFAEGSIKTGGKAG